MNRVHNFDEFYFLLKIKNFVQTDVNDFEKKKKNKIKNVKR